ncbi:MULTISPECIES: DNA-directed RNA polymerase subunit omega [Bacillus]|jgi:DNA-directed RNA polymerase subunit omega|uniref:DNA-directed RNA polymerase subunit omega n=1 Tax=Bacillus smithii 7_3_47FAA TaxID=665952 RepID=G9QML3_9BACI|nr:DNA-directed RNA polymerase subunit omega [Bacillus smithii]AKP46805.1 DNA-directed RNA polymerase omega subunit [Bacillus smithii]EHL76834.1 DNA-directed RNA polymerase, omega subunit [Bacillus smithii 7_3_47FAA]MED0660650.1 DNA-directed RNA polymerase subunit omega [Bacillus smithii]MED1419237.1 DNA-directed RNA polymerase subunit omega [Bacillus smithii]MED1456252.1 DNA-directed RNA polymerase subunit omega [Bacillus smithii]
MLYPSIDSLLKKIDSKYSLVSIAAKRARQLQDHPEDELLDSYVSQKYVGKALEEIDAEYLTLKEKTEGTTYSDEG